MRRRTLHVLLLILPGLNLPEVYSGDASPLSADSHAESFQEPLRGATVAPRLLVTLIERHCLDCHSGGSAEAGLDLQSLPFDLEDAESYAAWERVYERVERGEMPPADAGDPGVVLREATLEVLQARLHAACADRQRRQGRSLARRLNRDEYQNTLRELLGIQADYRHYLPNDGQAHGFDKTGEGLSISAEHATAYVTAADAALEEFLRGAGPAPPVLKVRYPQRFSTEHFSEEFQARHGFRFLDQPDAIVHFGTFLDKVLGERGGFAAPISGRYRFTIRARAWQSHQPVKARIRRGTANQQLGGAQLVGFVEFSPRGEEVPVEIYLEAGDEVLVSPYGVTRPFNEKSAIQIGASAKDYRGPGLAIEWVEIEGPLLSQWPPSPFAEYMGIINFVTASDAEAEAFLRRFLPRAFRRPVTDEEVERYLEVYGRAAQESGFRGGLKSALQAALCSPHFLFLNAPAGPLDDYALAARLSYFLWNSMPDDRLRRLAATGELHQSETLVKEVRRLLADAKAKAFVESFTGQWLDLRNIKATCPDPSLYPDHDVLLEWSMVEETQRFFDEILQQDLSIGNFLDSEFAIVNDRLAQHYRLAGVEGVAFRKVELPPDSVRGGLLTQASVLKVTADGTTSSPIVRGAWVNERILGEEIPPPPPGIPAVEPDIRGAHSIRDKLARHRSDPTCAKCHRKIDPPGFALETFDVIGGWRACYRVMPQGVRGRVHILLPMTYDPETGRPYIYQVGAGAEVDASGHLPGGESFQDFVEFRQLLVSQKERFARCLTEKLITYATGCAPEFADRATIDGILESQRNHDGLQSLIVAIVTSRLFLEQ